jgi:hypothetical protein
MEIERLTIRNREAYNQAKERLLGILATTRVPKIHGCGRREVIGGNGRTMPFGYGNRKFRGEFGANHTHRDLFIALTEFGNQVVPEGWDYQMITLNHNVLANKHVDKYNVGRSVIVGIGDYTGGDLTVWGPEEKAYDVKDAPLFFNGSHYAHQTLPFEGTRYTIIYFRGHRAVPCEGVSMIGK